jgi:hypothetical protein
VQGVFDRHDGAVDLAAGEPFKHLLEAGAGNYLDRGSEQQTRRLLAERAPLALKGCR